MHEEGKLDIDLVLTQPKIRNITILSDVFLINLCFCILTNQKKTRTSQLQSVSEESRQDEGIIWLICMFKARHLRCSLEIWICNNVHGMHQSNWIPKTPVMSRLIASFT